MALIFPGVAFQLWVALCVGIFLGGFMCTAMELPELRTLVNDMVIQCLELSRTPIKQAADAAGMSETHFRKALSGEGNRHIGIVHLMGLPYVFWLHFGPMLMWTVAKKHTREIIDIVAFKRLA